MVIEGNQWYHCTAEDMESREHDWRRRYVINFLHNQSNSKKILFFPYTKVERLSRLVRDLLHLKQGSSRVQEDGENELGVGIKSSVISFRSSGWMLFDPFEACN